jgi:hypothetical protein
MPLKEIVGASSKEHKYEKINVPTRPVDPITINLRRVTGRAVIQKGKLHENFIDGKWLRFSKKRI